MFEELYIIVAKIEETINNRPLTYMHDDMEGVSHRLTLAHLTYRRQIEITNIKKNTYKKSKTSV